ncbi:MAG TPA: hypothetical protein VMM14_03875 [Acidimicrobiia bacterium]|nr:hypothetical protein [Acidimicrobiia bacterium]
MDFRSHLGRPIDFRRKSNLAIAAIVLISGVVGVVLWLNGEPGERAVAPVYVFLVWALARELDPDHDWAALVAAVGIAVWTLVGGPVSTGFAIAGLMVAARITTSTTGRRPLPTDLAALTVFGVAIGFSVEGWLAGFGIALAIYLDDRLREENRRSAVAASALTAIGTTILANLTGAFPEVAPDISQPVTVVAGIVALLLLARDPAAPISQVDARHAAFMDGTRLHLSRSLVGILVFLMAILTGVSADGLVVVIATLALAVISNELALLRRREL